jgi:hypothetical protein
LFWYNFPVQDQDLAPDQYRKCEHSSSHDGLVQYGIYSFTVLADPLKFVLIVVLAMMHLYEYKRSPAQPQSHYKNYRAVSDRSGPYNQSQRKIK